MQNHKVRLDGNGVTLVPYLAHHVPRYHEWMTDPALLRLTCSEPLSLDEEYENQASWLAADDKLTFIVLRKGATHNGAPRYEMLGDCNAFLSQQEEDEAEVEVSISEASYRRLGVAREVIRLLMVYVARNIGRRVFVAKILSDNEPSIDLFSRQLGFEHFRDVKVFDESHFRRVLSSDADVDAVAAECGFTAGTYTYPASAGEQREPDELRPQRAGSDADATEGVSFAYTWGTWEQRAASLASLPSLLRHSSDASSVSAGVVVAEGVVLSSAPVGDSGLCGAVAATIGDNRQVVIAHSSHPNVLFIQGKLVSICPIAAGDALLINVNASMTDPLPYPFPDAPFTSHWDKIQQRQRWQEASTAEDAAGVVAFVQDGVDESAGIANAEAAPVIVGRGGLAPKYLPEWYVERWMRYADAPVRRWAYEHDSYVPKSTVPDLVEVLTAGLAGMTTHASAAIASGTAIWSVTGIKLPFPTVYTLCVSEGTNVLFNCDAQCLAHSCDPNTRIDVEANAPGEAKFRVIALRDVAKGEVISFNYLTTEWSMDEPFDCGCGAAGCWKTIHGFKHLTSEQQAALLPDTLPVIQQQHASLAP